MLILDFPLDHTLSSVDMLPSVKRAAWWLVPYRLLELASDLHCALTSAVCTCAVLFRPYALTFLSHTACALPVAALEEKFI